MSEVRYRQDARWWAWQFLRRNEGYRAEWHEMVARAKKARDAGVEDPDSMSPILAEELLDPSDPFFIPNYSNCQKWGLLSWINPEIETPDQAKCLKFVDKSGPGDRRDRSEESRLSDPNSVVYTFDLRRPIKQQVEEARKYLQVTQSHYRRTKNLDTKAVRRWPRNWPRYVEILDKEAELLAQYGKWTWSDLQKVFCPNELKRGVPPGDSSVKGQHEAALKLVNGGYIGIAHMPLGD